MKFCFISLLFILRHIEAYQIGVIGAGIGGASVALQLASEGYQVLLFEKSRAPMSRTSGINPGRSALGFHYTDLTTSLEMLQGSIEFSRVYPNVFLRDAGARYFVVKDSQVSKEDYLRHCHSIQSSYSINFASDDLFKILHESEYEEEVNTSQIALGIQTREHLIDVPKLQREVIKQLAAAADKIQLLTRHEIIDAKKEVDENQFRLTYRRTHDGTTGFVLVDQVVNAAWEYRHKVDSFLGYYPKPNTFTNRLKILAQVRLPKRARKVHSMMFVRGPFAMMANRMDGTAFLTFAPVTNKNKTSEIDVLPEWETWITTDDQVMTAEKRQIGQEIIMGATKFIPMLRDAELEKVRAGVIYSTGDADPWNLHSKMHERSNTGFHELEPGWFSLDTGKLIFGPMHANRIVKKIVSNARLFILV